MKSFLKDGISIIFGSFSILCGLTAIMSIIFSVYSATFEYNSEGKYFDEGNSVIYEDSAIVGYAGLALILLIMGQFLGFFTAKKYKN